MVTIEVLKKTIAALGLPGAF